MHRRSRFIAPIVLLICTTLSACQIITGTPSPSQTPKPTTPVDSSEGQKNALIQGVSCPESFQEGKNVEKDIRIDVGEPLTLNLGNNPSMPCSWVIPEIEQPEIIVQVDHYTKWPAEGATPMPGAPGTAIWVFEAQKKGQTEISLACNCLDEAGEEEELEGTLKTRIQVEK